MRSRSTREANRNGFTSAAAQTVAHELSQQLGKILGQYVEPSSFTFNEARGYWSHIHQDVMKISGHFRVGNLAYSIGCWEYNLSTLARSGCHVIDERGKANSDAQFRIEKGRAALQTPHKAKTP